MLRAHWASRAPSFAPDGYRRVVPAREFCPIKDAERDTFARGATVFVRYVWRIPRAPELADDAATTGSNES